jgi:flavodoxin
MRALVVFESMFGDTETIARAVADGLSGAMRVDIEDVATAPRVDADVDLLVVGGPTHAFGMSRPNTRNDAVRQGGSPAAATIGVREWLDEQQPTSTARAAAFDTRIKKWFIPGSAAHSAGDVLRRRGFRLVAPPESFRVTGTTGPLAAGEEDRARQWGLSLAAQVAATR